MWSHCDMKIRIPHYLGLPRDSPSGAAAEPCWRKVPDGRCPIGSAGRIATGNPPPLQPPVVVDSNPTTLMTNKPRTLSGTGLAHQGASKVLELAETLPSFLVSSKTITLIYQSFYFAITAKNAIFGSLMLRSVHNSDKWHFNAWFMPSVGNF